MALEDQVSGLDFASRPVPIQSPVAYENCVILRARGYPQSYGNSLAPGSPPCRLPGCLAHQPLHRARPHAVDFYHTRFFHVPRGPGCFPPSPSLQLPHPKTPAIHLSCPEKHHPSPNALQPAPHGGGGAGLPSFLISIIATFLVPHSCGSLT